MRNDCLDIILIDTFGGQEFPDMMAVLIRVFFIVYIVKITDCFPVILVTAVDGSHSAHSSADGSCMSEKMILCRVFRQYFVCFC